MCWAAGGAISPARVLLLCRAAPGDRVRVLPNLDESPWELLMITGLIYALPPAAIYYVFKRYMMGGFMAGAVKS